MKKSRKFGLGSLALCAVVVTVLALVAPASAAKGKSKSKTKTTTTATATAFTPDMYGVVNVTADAATDHEIMTSTAFPNYTNGAVDNFYTMAHSHIDNSPFAEGTASPGDTGPLGQTAAAGNFSQPQYADARWPGNGGTATFGNQGGPAAVANADSYSATADSEEASAAGTPGSSSTPVATPKGVTTKLKTLLAAWKATWLPKLHIKPPKVKLPVETKLPGVTVPTVTLPVNGSGGSGTTTGSTSTTDTSTGQSTTGSTSTTPSSSGPSPNAALGSTTSTKFDPTTGALIASGRSSLGRLSLAGGAIAIAGIDVTAQITNNGTPADKFAIDVGAASIGGVPVTIDQDGVHIQGQSQALPYAQADSTLNGVLKQAGVQIFTVQPETTKDTNQETLTATGVHVIFTQPVDQAGVPAQTVEHILGEVQINSLGAPGTPLPTLNLNGSGTGAKIGSSGSGSSTGVGGGSSVGGSSVGSSGTSSYTTGGTSGTSGTAGSGSQSVPTELTSALSKPTWLLIAFLLWQVLAVSTGASLWTWRKGGAA